VKECREPQRLLGKDPPVTRVIGLSACGDQRVRVDVVGPRFDVALGRTLLAAVANQGTRERYAASGMVLRLAAARKREARCIVPRLWLNRAVTLDG
jgi:hypothetical protein